MTNTLNKIIHNGDEYELPWWISNNTEGTTSTVSNIRVWTSTEYWLITPEEWQISLVYAESWWRWQPWVNTIAYYPLDTDFNDASWNSRNLANTNATITTLNGVSCAYYNWSAYTQYQGYSLTNSARTISVWCYVSSNGGAIVYNGKYENVDCPWCLGCNTWQTWVYVTDWMNTYISWTISNNTWILLTVTQSWTDAVLYVNWVQAGATSSYNSETNTPNWWCLWAKFYRNNHSEKLNWYLSKVILEDKVRTAQEVSDYFDLTKWDYWIS